MSFFGGFIVTIVIGNPEGIAVLENIDNGD